MSQSHIFSILYWANFFLKVKKLKEFLNQRGLDFVSFHLKSDAFQL